VSAAPARPLWARTLPGGASAEAVSPDGTRLFVVGAVKTHFETVAFNAATGARAWAKAYPASTFSAPVAIAVSPDGARVYVTGNTRTTGPVATVAYDARTGQQLWASRYNPTAAYGAYVTALAVSPDGTTVYVTGDRRVSSRQAYAVVIAYAAATGRQRWLRYYKSAGATSVAVSPDGKTVYVTGSALTLAYQATGTLKWAAWYHNPYGQAAGSQIVAGPGGNAVYVVGAAQNTAGHWDIATFAYRAATGRCLWLARHYARGGGSERIAATPDGRTVIVIGARNGDRTGGYAIAAYNASNGATRWTQLAPAAAYGSEVPDGLVIDPHGKAVFVASTPVGRGYDTAAWSVAGGTLLWTSSYAAAKVWGPAAIARSGDGTRIFEAGSAGLNGGMIIVAYRT